MAALVCGVAGFALLAFAAFKTWQVVSRGHPGGDVIPAAVAAILAFALISVGRSARRAGLAYLSGRRSVSGDVARAAGRSLARRRSRRPRA
jgi:hypothetical protein